MPQRVWLAVLNYLRLTQKCIGSERNNMKERVTHVSRLVLSYSKQRRLRMCCHRTQNMFILKSLHLSFTSEPVVCASMVCTDDTQAYLLILKSLNLPFTSQPVVWAGMICTDDMQAYLLIFKSLNLSFMSEPVVWAGMICTDDMQASRWQCCQSKHWSGSRQVFWTCSTAPAKSPV